MKRKTKATFLIFVIFFLSSVMNFRVSKADTGFSPLPGYAFSVSKSIFLNTGSGGGSFGQGNVYIECYGAKVRSGSNQIEFEAHIQLNAQSDGFTIDNGPIFLEIYDPDTGTTLTNQFSVDFPRIDCPSNSQRESTIPLNFPFSGSADHRLGIRIIGGLYQVPPNPPQTQNFELLPGQNNRLLFSDFSSTGILVSAFSGPGTDRFCAACTKTESFTANPASIQVGQSSTLTWVISNPNENGLGDPIGEVRIRNQTTNLYEPIPPNLIHNRTGSIVVSPTVTTNYQLEYSTGTCGDTLTTRVVVNSGSTRRGHYEVRYSPPTNADPEGNYPAGGTAWVGPTIECPDWSCGEYATARDNATSQQNTLTATEVSRLAAINQARYNAYITALDQWRAQYGGASNFDEARAWQLEQFAIAQQNFQAAQNAYIANYCGGNPGNCPAPGSTVTGPMAPPNYTFLFPTRMARPKSVAAAFH